MSPSDAQKKASNKYNLENMATIGCKLKKAQAKAFKAYCERKGTTANAELKQYILNCINDTSEEDEIDNVAGADLH